MATQKGRNWSSGDIVTAANLSSVERGVSAVSSLYEPTTWANGDTVTAAALNNIEQGIVNAGSGSSDFSIVTVTVTNNILTNDVELNIPIAFEDEPSFASASAFIESSQTIIIPVILYKGLAYANYNSNASNIDVDATGDIVVDGQYKELQITGNGTITISNSSGELL